MHVARDLVVAAAAALAVERRHALRAFLFDGTVVEIADVGGQVPLRRFQFAPEPLDFRFKLSSLGGHAGLRLAKQLTGGLHGRLRRGERLLDRVDPVERLEDLVLEHLRGHLVGRDLLGERLILAIRLAGVEFAVEVADLCLGRLQLQLLLVGGHLGLLDVVLHARPASLRRLDLRGVGSNLPRAGGDPCPEIGQLRVDAMQRPHDFTDDDGGHGVTFGWVGASPRPRKFTRSKAEKHRAGCLCSRPVMVLPRREGSRLSGHRFQEGLELL